MAESATGETVPIGGVSKSVDYEYDDDDEFDMEAEMLRREFREASLLANGGSTAAVLEPTSQTQVDLTADCRPAAAAVPPPHQLHATAADHSSGGSSSADSRVAEMAYAYGNQSEYTAEDGGASKHICKPVVKSAAVPSFAAAVAANNNNNNDDEYLVEQRLLGNGTDGGVGAGTMVEVTGVTSPPPKTNDKIICSPPEELVAVATAAAQ